MQGQSAPRPAAPRPERPKSRARPAGRKTCVGARRHSLPRGCAARRRGRAVLPRGGRGVRAVRHLRPSASLSVSRDTLGLRGRSATSRTRRARFSRAEWKNPRTARALMGHGASVVRLVPLAFPAPQGLPARASPAPCVSTPRAAPPLPHQRLPASALPTPRVVPTPLPPPFRRARSHTLLPADQPIPVKVRIFARASLGRPSDRPRTVSGRE